MPTGTLMVCDQETFHRVLGLIHERHMEELEMSRYQLITDTYARIKPYFDLAEIIHNDETSPARFGPAYIKSSKHRRSKKRTPRKKHSRRR